MSRCALIGPVVISSYLGFLENIAAKNRTTTASRAQSTVQLMALYERIDCPVPALNETIECITQAVVEPSPGQSIGEIAGACMKDAGMAVREQS